MNKRLKDSSDAYKEQSKLRLTKIAQSKIKTTMIGSLQSIEDHFGFLWAHGETECSEEEQKTRLLYDNLRQEILDKGNQQLRNIAAEVSEYEVEWKRHTLTLKPVGV
jgi:hypothetical protein